MTAALMFQRDERRLAGPTEALAARPDSVPVVDSLESDLDDGGVMAVVHQASALVARNPDSLAARARLAHAFLGASQASQARREARMVVNAKNASTDPMAVVSAALVLSAAGDPQGAEGALGILGGHWYPHLYAQLAAQRGDLELALARLESAVDLASLTTKGWVLIEMRRYADAVRCFRTAISEAGASPELYLNLGYAYAALGSLRKAIRATSAAQAMAPASRTAGFNLAAFYSAAGDLQGALNALEPLRTNRADELSVRLATASLYSRFGRLDRAERELQSVLSAQAGWAATADGRAVVKADLVAVRQAQAKLSSQEAFERVYTIAQSQDFADLRVARLLLAWLTRSSQADLADDLLRVLKTRHDSAALGAFRARAAFLRGDLSTALECAERWAENEPFDAAAVMMQTYLLVEKSELDTAITVGRRALDRMPAEVVIRNNVAYSLAVRGDLEQAWRTLTQTRSQLDHFCMPTAGFIQIQRGHVDEGLNLYLQAAQEADRLHATEAAALIRYRALLEAKRLGRDLGFNAAGLEQILQDDSRFHLAAAEFNAAHN